MKTKVCSDPFSPVSDLLSQIAVIFCYYRSYVLHEYKTYIVIYQLFIGVAKEQGHKDGGDGQEGRLNERSSSTVQSVRSVAATRLFRRPLGRPFSGGLFGGGVAGGVHRSSRGCSVTSHSCVRAHAFGHHVMRHHLAGYHRH